MVDVVVLMKTSITVEGPVSLNRSTENTWDYSHTQNPISWGARLLKGVRGGKEHSILTHTPVDGMMQAYNIHRIETRMFVLFR